MKISKAEIPAAVLSIKRKSAVCCATIMMIVSMMAGVAANGNEAYAGVKNDNSAESLTSISKTSGDVSGADATAKKEIRELEAENGVLLFADSRTAAVNNPPAVDKVELSYSRSVRYEGYSTHFFKVKYDGKTKIGYCVQPKEAPPGQGTWTAQKHSGRLMMKALYYSYGYPGYDKRMRPYISKRDIDDDYTDDDGAYALSHMILSYIYDNESMNSDAFIGVGSQTKKLVKTITDKIEKDWPEPPADHSLSFSKTNVTAKWDKKLGKQVTPEIKLNGHDDNKIYMTVPAYTTMVKESNGNVKKYVRGKDNSVKVKVYGGEKFYFTAPPEVSGTFNSPKMEGSLASFQPYVIKVSGKQDIVFCGVGATAEVSFSIKWADLGNFEMIKSSSNEKITSGNECYSLKDAKYGLYIKSSGKLYAEMITDKSGKAKISNIPVGEYLLKEIKAPKGYAFDTKSYNISIKKGKNSKKVYDAPQNADIGLMVMKKDKETGKASSVYGPSVEGAEYRISYYDGYYDDCEALAEKKAERAWTVKTDKNGEAELTEDYLVEGEDLYKDKSGNTVMPLGTVTIEEVKPPEGYNIDSNVFVRKLAPGKKVEKQTELEAVVHQEQLVRGDVEFTKINGRSGEHLADIPFTIVSETTGEKTRGLTDKNGRFSTKENGMWIGEGKKQEGIGALPYGKYHMYEERCENNKGLQLIKDISFEINDANAVLDLGKLLDEELGIKTSAFDSKDKDKTLHQGSELSVTDRVTYYGLEPGRLYLLKGVLIDKTSKKPIMNNGKPVAAELRFTPESAKGSVDVVFNFDGTELGGKSLVVFEELYEDKFMIAEHKDINDSGQTVRVVVPDKAVETGEDTPWFLLIIAVTISAICGLMCLIRRTE